MVMAIKELFNYADQREGRVRTHSWGYCRSETCQHQSHDPYFEYPVTILRNAETLWEGEAGEEIVQSNVTGRIWYTRYKPNGHYAPIMKTVELHEKRIPAELWQELVDRYASPRYELLQRLKTLEDTGFEGEEVQSGTGEVLTARLREVRHEP
jgi:hypothetical protein